MDINISKTELKNIKTDCDELLRILQALQPDSGNQQAWDNVTADISEEFLQKRAYWQKNNLKEIKELSNLLEKVDCQKSNCEQCAIRLFCNAYIKETREHINDKAPSFIDLFCGAGGLSLGFRQEGFNVSLANDIQDCCIETYIHNHPEVPRKHIVLGDVNDVVENINSLTRFTDTDLIIGGPPCQGFSMANRQRLIDDPRNHLYKSYVEAVDKIRPKFLVMENVRGMLSVADQVVADFERIGYQTHYEVLRAEDFGVPQHRERLIYIGNRLGVDNKEIFAKLHQYSQSLPTRPLSDALEGLRPLTASRIKNSTEKDTLEHGFKFEENKATSSNEYINTINQGRIVRVMANHKARFNNDRDIEIFGRLNPGDKSNDPKIADIMPYKSRNDIFKDKYFKLEPDKPCKTITAHMKFDCNMYIHPNQARGLTPREAARVQSYPDDYFFRGAYTKTYMQVGNSVPPLLGRAIAHILKKYL